MTIIIVIIPVIIFVIVNTVIVHVIIILISYHHILVLVHAHIFPPEGYLDAKSEVGPPEIRGLTT